MFTAVLFLQNDSRKAKISALMAKCLTNKLCKFHEKNIEFSENNYIFVGVFFAAPGIYAQRAPTSAHPEYPYFGLWTPVSEASSVSPPKFDHFVLEPCPIPRTNVVKIRSQFGE